MQGAISCRHRGRRRQPPPGPCALPRPSGSSSGRNSSKHRQQRVPKSAASGEASQREPTALFPPPPPPHPFSQLQVTGSSRFSALMCWKHAQNRAQRAQRLPEHPGVGWEKYCTRALRKKTLPCKQSSSISEMPKELAMTRTTRCYSCLFQRKAEELNQRLTLQLTKTLGPQKQTSSEK